MKNLLPHLQFFAFNFHFSLFTFHFSLKYRNFEPAFAQQKPIHAMNNVPKTSTNRRVTTKQPDIRYQRSITLPNDVQTIPQLARFSDTVCEAAGLDMEMCMKMNLAIEEAVVNVMNYAYPKGVEGTVSIDATISDEGLKFVISDSGKPFDPTARAEVDTTLPADKRGIGGLGIHLFRQIMDQTSYEYINGRNVLSLLKKL